jgi:HPt (histidine-containing phosphotransfer) domain-containing protein
VIAMRVALADGDFSTLGRLGHGMRGSGGGYGFQAITDIGKGLELAAKSSDHEASQKLLGELTSYLDRVEVI